MTGPIIIHEVGKGLTGKDPSGTMNFIGFDRLAREALREAGEVRPDEEITHIVVGHLGLSLYFKRKE